MGMSEPKRKVKYSIDPNALLWAKDESKFGKKLMEKMGWEQGKGLGAKEDGIKENIKIKFKDNTKGVGYNKNDYDDVWIDHQDSFDSLLSSLKKETKAEEAGEAAAVDTDETKLRSLEQKSKESRARVHYRKFTRGKDLTNATKVDLDCILGRHKRKSKVKEESEDTSGSVSQDEATVADELKPKSSFQTVTNALSINDYFKAKMDEINKRRQAAATEEKASDTDSTNEKVEEAVVEEIEHKKAKKKKRKHKEEEQELVIEAVEEVVDDSEEKKEKKKRKKKNREVSEDVQSNETVETVEKEQENGGESSSSKTADDNQDQTAYKTHKEQLYKIQDPFKGSNLFDVVGYTPYTIFQNVHSLLDDKQKRAEKKRKQAGKNLEKDPNFYNMQKKPAVDLEIK